MHKNDIVHLDLKVRSFAMWYLQSMAQHNTLTIVSSRATAGKYYVLYANLSSD